LAAKLFPNGLKSETLAAGTQIIKIHQSIYGPLWFSPAPGATPAYRFDAPNGEYRIMYTAKTLDGAFVETVLRKSTGRVLRRGFVEERSWSTMTVQRPLRLAKLYDDGLLWHGTDAGIGSSNSYAEPRKMAVNLHGAFKTLDGIAWRARHDNGEMCYALFDRVRTADLQPVSTLSFKAHWTEVERLMDKYGAHFDRSPPIPPP
jgi:hypothetical protein